MENLKFCKVRAVKSPVRAHPEDAGIDFFVPEDLKKDEFLTKCDVTKQYVRVNCDGDVVKEIVLAPGQSVLIPSGIHVKVPTGHALIYMNKSGVASKKHLHVGACVTGNTIVKTNYGNFSASTLTKDFCDKNNIPVEAYDIATNTIKYCKCDGFRQVKTGKCLRITFDDGSFVEGDEEHQIWYNNKWIMLKDL